jgi:hypothetical protein
LRERERKRKRDRREKGKGEGEKVKEQNFLTTPSLALSFVRSQKNKSASRAPPT